jgi:hypothetical protein
MSDNKDTRTAGQKIEDLERVVSMLYQSVGSLDGAVKSLLGTQRDMVLVRDALRLLNKKTEAIIQTAKEESGISASNVSALVIQMNVEDLKTQVQEYISRGNLTPADEVSATSYLVCEEQNLDGTIANPRIQFRLDSQDADTQATLTGKKVGDTVSFGEGKYSAKILEIYTLVDNPGAAQNAPAPAAETQAPTDQASSDTSAQSAAPADETPAPTQTPQAATPAAPAQNSLPQETPVAFGLSFHGQPEAELSAPSTPGQN